MKSNLKLFNEGMVKTNNPQAVDKADYFYMWQLGRIFERKRIKEEITKEIKDCLTNGWSELERSHWKNYLEDEIKPYYPSLYKFLKETKRR